MKVQIISRNYEWDCGDGCCSESRRQVEIYTETEDKFFGENIFPQPPEFLETVLQNEAVQEFLTTIQSRAELSGTDQFEFEFVYTETEFDY